MAWQERASAAPAFLPDLPEAAVACILQHIPLQQRLSSCALVCRAWAAAAVATSAVIDYQFQFSKPLQFKQLRDWLRKRGATVMDFTATRPANTWSGSCPLQLPIAKLTQLRILNLDNLKVQLTGVKKNRKGAPLTGPGPVLPQLQELRLHRCQLSIQLSYHLLNATALTKLHWEDVAPFTDNTDPVIAHQRWNTQRLLQGIPVMWHQLQQLQQLPKLSELQLAGHILTAADIAPLSNLQGLQRFCLTLEGHAEDREPCARALALLSALQHLTQLQHLELNSCGLALVQPQGDSLQCFSALTASTQLTALLVTEDSKLWPAPIPQAAFEYMFPPGCVLSKLSVLGVCSKNRGACVDSAQVGRIAASCPALQQLTLRGVIPKGFDVSCLQQLPAGVLKVEGIHIWTRPAP